MDAGRYPTFSERHSAILGSEGTIFGHAVVVDPSKMVAREAPYGVLADKVLHHKSASGDAVAPGGALSEDKPTYTQHEHSHPGMSPAAQHATSRQGSFSGCLAGYLPALAHA